MAKTYRDADADLSLIQAKRVAIIGYGSQGHAHALNLRDSGVEVRVGLRDASKHAHGARDAGLVVQSVAEVARWAEVIMNLTPDQDAAKIHHDEIAPNMQADATLMFAHGFNIRYGAITPPPGADVSLVAPTAQGFGVRRLFTEGSGTPGLVAVEQDASGTAWPLALSYAKAIGCTRIGVIQTTFAEETETDLFGEQVVLCGGTAALIKAGFHTLVDAGYQPELAYFECLHQLKLIVDLIHDGGLEYMNRSISDTAEWGGYLAQPRIVTGEVRSNMRAILTEIQDGSFARRFIAENEAGGRTLAEFRKAEAEDEIEGVGAKVRAGIPG